MIRRVKLARIAGNGLRQKHGSVVRNKRKGITMATKTRVSARRSEGVKCLEMGSGAGVVVDPATLERLEKSNHGSCKSIKPGSEEFERMVSVIPNADRLHEVRCPLKAKKHLKEVI
ncbi:hypothetical protein [Sporomusa sp.]|uniref:hypothetical protein n=1 Tax=Sporomusa sp. TaxID=2078658 RepID=UPI002C711314|nr:hypothetical protein [Sporomusa sp.]HWR07773.1 hypothetical protein [Sporomusa sp.]